MQTITIIGNLVADAEKKKNSQSGNEFLTFRVAVNENVGDSKTATFYDVSYPSVKVHEYLKKGLMVAVVGKFRPTTYTTKEGETRYNLAVIANELQFLGGNKGENKN